MKYRITRTSTMCPPCPQAYSEGHNKLGKELWFVDINTLEDLQKLVEEVGEEIIVTKDELEIYDTYRE